MCFYLYFNLAISRRKSQELEHAHKERHWVRIIYRNYLSLAVMASKLFSYCQKRLSIIAVSHNVSSTAQMLTVLVIFNPRLEQIFLFLHNAPDLRLMLSNMMSSWRTIRVAHVRTGESKQEEPMATLAFNEHI